MLLGRNQRMPKERSNVMNFKFGFIALMLLVILALSGCAGYYSGYGYYDYPYGYSYYGYPHGRFYHYDRDDFHHHYQHDRDYR